MSLEDFISNIHEGVNESPMDTYEYTRGDSIKALNAIRMNLGKELGANTNVRPIASKYLTFTEGTSNKYHYFAMFKLGDECVAANAFARIGYDPQVKIFARGDEATVKASYKEKLNSKIKKGYAIQESDGPRKSEQQFNSIVESKVNEAGEPRCPYCGKELVAVADNRYDCPKGCLPQAMSLDQIDSMLAPTESIKESHLATIIARVKNRLEGVYNGNEQEAAHDKLWLQSVGNLQEYMDDNKDYTDDEADEASNLYMRYAKYMKYTRESKVVEDAVQRPHDVRLSIEDDQVPIDHPDPSGLLHAYDSNNVLLVWWYNPATAEFVKSNNPKALHVDDINTKVKDYANWVRGRVFNYQGKNYLVVYYPEKKKVTGLQLADIFDKAYNSVDDPITRIIDDNGKDISKLLESYQSYPTESSESGEWKAFGVKTLPIEEVRKLVEKKADKKTLKCKTCGAGITKQQSVSFRGECPECWADVVYDKEEPLEKRLAKYPVLESTQTASPTFDFNGKQYQADIEVTVYEQGGHGLPEPAKNYIENIKILKVWENTPPFKEVELTDVLRKRIEHLVDDGDIELTESRPSEKYGKCSICGDEKHKQELKKNKGICDACKQAIATEDEYLDSKTNEAQLPTADYEGKRYFVDKRLEELRNVEDPHDVVVFDDIGDEALTRILDLVEPEGDDKFESVTSFGNMVTHVHSKANEKTMDEFFGRGGRFKKFKVGALVVTRKDGVAHLSLNRYDAGSNGIIIGVDGGGYVDVRMEPTGKVETFKCGDLQVKSVVRAFCTRCGRHTIHNDGRCQSCRSEFKTDADVASE